MKNITVMMKPASSLCNMRCKYCFYADVSSLRSVASYGIMTEDTADRIIDNIFADLDRGDHLTLSFQGGEPTLAGLDFFRHAVKRVESHNSRGVRVSYALQTNGYLLDEAWCAFLRQYDFLVGLSMDGPARCHNGARLDPSGNGTFSKVAGAKALMDRHGVSYNILTVLTNELARHPQQIWRFLEEQKIGYVQFIPCLGPLEGESSPYALTPQRYTDFYSALFARWYSSFSRGRYISVKLFDDLVRLLAFGECNACGLLGQCHPQIIVEADGSVYPCDFYVLDAYKMGNLADTPLGELYTGDAAEKFQNRPGKTMALCGSCPYKRICGGGCRRMRQETCGSQDASLCGHRLFLDRCLPTLRQIAAVMRR